MTTSKNRRINAWHQRKHNQYPTHGRVKSFAELAEEPGTLSQGDGSAARRSASLANAKGPSAPSSSEGESI
ncbi:DUF6254 family protein [Paenibacillus xylaniclasticus]|uniref:DUF6254 family protein n=1 Tax=Paenibacillus xylaniclasticus TaxID=588083 RepID=UPI000FDB4E18|nr:MULTISPECIES: DUF6254 family protein [Paenibacillus]GFN30115.1 hypothetical protein PCURB6_03750 [Paenibacillus curdlanolyticus]